MTKEAWDELMGAFGIGEADQMYEQFIRAYSEEHRFYHTLEHIEFMLKVLHRNRHSALYPKEVELAIIFHDIIYDVNSKTNELQSAELAKEFLSSKDVDEEVVSRVFELIVSTQHDSHLLDKDQQLLSDSDLAILGESPEKFDQYEAAIRQEYSHVPDDQYRVGRLKVLNSFLRKPQIYHHQYFREVYEEKARENLRRSIEGLDKI
ncbi:hypothetical protein LNTAR_00650 [Lentisphaera araneosa HTCC2155]|jgi:predicted metal-dependent HD superfamily phosphohydrolase|uniref:N-methyl-D-aspartate receptor NMDAR2C subunit n=1 Tax=Lentisphaera araneosa HTCC2155 TaxID=313628 RepID=A6DKG7_9BACT|nr:hypothetical protein [Lentisphaera araneosa]EDM27865.1 hypothetical protein LNTAR_00650 [Lentisphaera araneosa HTCC2155]